MFALESPDGPGRRVQKHKGTQDDESILCVVDGGKGIRKALVDVLGDLAVIQRCQIHKLYVAFVMDRTPFSARRQLRPRRHLACRDTQDGRR